MERNLATSCKVENTHTLYQHFCFYLYTSEKFLHVNKNKCTSIFITAKLFYTIYAPINCEMNVKFIFIMEYNKTVKTNEINPQVSNWIHLENNSKKEQATKQYMYHVYAVDIHYIYINAKMLTIYYLWTHTYKASFLKIQRSICTNYKVSTTFV